MNKRRINWTISEYAYERLTEKAAELGLSLSEGAQRAIEAWAPLRIEIEYSEDGLFGEEGTDGHDWRASFDEYERQLYTKLHEAYPKAEIHITDGIGDTFEVNGQTDHSECPWVSQIVHDVWESWEWLIKTG